MDKNMPDLGACEKCKQKPATVYVEQFINNKTTGAQLCQECAMAMSGGINFESFLKSMLEHMWISNSGGVRPAKETEALVCKVCGMTYNEFKKTSRFGCAECYSAFNEQLDVVLKNIQGSNVHEGKIPRSMADKITNDRELEKLKQSLLSAIANEEFEKAAVLRDKIRELTAL